MTVALDAARGGMVAEWDRQDVADLARLLRRFADDVLQFAGAAKSSRRGD